MGIYRFLSLVLCRVLIVQFALPTAAQAAATNDFKAYEVTMINSFKDSHQLFQAALKAKNIAASTKKAMTEQLAKKSSPLPEFRLMKDGKLRFQSGGRTHSLSRESTNTFRLDGKLIDLNAKEMDLDVSLQTPILFGFPISIQTANAEPITTGIVIAAIIIIVVGVACSAPKVRLSSQAGAKTISLGTAADQVMNDHLRNIRREMCRGGCGVACAAPAGGNFDHMKYLTGELCPAAARYYVDVAEVDRHAEELEPVVYPNEERKTKFMANISRLHTRRSANLTLDEVDRQLLAGLVNDPDIMRWCVARIFGPQDDATSVAPTGITVPAEN